MNCKVTLGCVLCLGALVSGIVSVSATDTEGETSFRLVITIEDGSRLVGSSSVRSFPLHSEALGKLTVPLENIESVTMIDAEIAVVRLRNGDVIRGGLDLARIKLEAIFGNVDVPVAKIRNLQVSGLSSRVAASGLLLHFSFDERDGEAVIDHSEHRHRGMLRGARLTEHGQIGGGIELRGRDYVEVSGDGLWSMHDTDFTIAMWVKFDRFASPEETAWSCLLIGNDEGPNDQPKWTMGVARGFFCFHTNGPGLGSRSYAQAPFRPSLGRWYHLAVTRRGNDITTYIDGRRGASESMNRPMPNPRHPLTIGQAEDIGFVNGILDEVCIWKRALSDSEIRELFEAAGALGDDH